MDGYREPDPPSVPVPQKLREALEISRRNEICFDHAWLPALRAAVNTVKDRHEQPSWRRALEATRGRWESAYNLEPATQNDAAMSLLASDRGLFLPAGRACEGCGGVVTSTYPLARFCSKRCATASTAWRKVAA